MAVFNVFQNDNSFLSNGYIIAIALCMAILYFVSLAIYRLYLSPLAKFPGPKLAALTSWVEIYYELAGDGGMFSFEYAKWHDKYGPIIRISPTELHIQDSEFYETLYSASRPLDRPQRLEHRFNNPLSTFATSNNNLHRQRRAALNPFFSKQKIVKHTPAIRALMGRLCSRISKEYMSTGKVLALNDMWACWASDIIVDFVFDRGYNFIDEPNFQSPFTTAMVDLLEPVHAITHFPLMLKLLQSLPDAVVTYLQPGMASVISFNQEMADQISGIIEKRASFPSEAKSNTVFSAILDSDLPPEEVSLTRLQHEAISFIGAGFETTMRALSLACFHILDNPPVLHILCEELQKAIPDLDNPPPLKELEQLPYLTACIEETLRLSYGLSQRIPRVLTDVSTRYRDWTIPRNATVSMDNVAVSHDENIFPDSFAFKPSRWLNNPLAPDGKQLSRYIVSFGKGARSCIGMQLAYAELYIGLSTVFRKFKFELYDTKRDAVDLYMDRFVPRPKPGTKGVRVLVTDHQT